MKKCVICETIINDSNKTKEHIIHNALGGTLIDYEIYCKKCNERFGSGLDKKFVQIFACITDKIKMHKDRNSKGTSYPGVMLDKNGNIFNAIFKNGKVQQLKNEQQEYIKYRKDEYKTLCYFFNLYNDAFKQGISKIAFNYAIHCGLNPNELEIIFDNSVKKFTDIAIIIPFFPMTPFDNVIENSSIVKLFHVVRIFNMSNYLFAYIELFNTFQYYVLLSEKYDFKLKGNIDKSVGNIIESKEPIDEKILNLLTPKDYKDALIVAQDYNLDKEKIIENLKRLNDYDSKENTEKMKLFLSQIGKEAFNKKK